MTRTDSPTKKSSKRQRRTRLAVSHEELIPGTRLMASLKGNVYEAVVIGGDAGKPEIEFGGERYTSLSAAGRAAVRRQLQLRAGCAPPCLLLTRKRALCRYPAGLRP